MTPEETAAELDAWAGMMVRHAVDLSAALADLPGYDATRAQLAALVDQAAADGLLPAEAPEEADR